ncbi:MAG: hypothetical protein ABR567_19370 [Myxococcales bacterium]|nr:hypothetical protein [Myxococcales bacterium]
MWALLLAPLLVFHGNVALVEDVYRAALDLPAGTKPTPANARSIAVRLRHFLHSAGYSLATVHAHVEGEQIAVQIDEGRLDKIIFVGGGAFETLRLRLDLHLHDDVFNKPELERQLKGLSERLGLSQFAYDVVPVANVSPPKVQLEDIEPLEELSMGLVRPGRPYELHILVQPGTFHSGISPELEIDSIEGGGLGAVYHTGRLLLREDRLDIRGRLAGAVRERLDNSASRVVFTRALGEASYELPPLGGVVRPTLTGRFNLSDRQRPDLQLESFQFATLEGAAEVLFVPIKQLRASVGAGIERRLLYSLQPATPATALSPAVGERAHTREFGEAALQLTFDADSLRLDRHHQLAFEARIYGSPGPGDSGAVHLFGRWQRLFPFGWNEVWAEVRGLSRTGYVLFPEEESIGGGDFLRGPFGGEYARRLAALDLEYRFSLLRDVFKLGVFHNAVAYGAMDANRDTEKLAVADSFGVGVHALLIDEFQLDAYFGVGYATGHRFDRGAALSIRQAF